jgi:hypothetical protein
MNGRDMRTGRFTPGNRCATGNPHAKRVARLQQMLSEAVSDEDCLTIVRKLIERAKRGHPWAVDQLLNRLIGRPLAGMLGTQVDGIASQSLTDRLHCLDEQDLVTLARIQEKLRTAAEKDE